MDKNDTKESEVKERSASQTTELLVEVQYSHPVQAHQAEEEKQDGEQKKMMKMKKRKEDQSDHKKRNSNLNKEIEEKKNKIGEERQDPLR